MCYNKKRLVCYDPLPGIMHQSLPAVHDDEDDDDDALPPWVVAGHFQSSLWGRAFVHPCVF